MSVEAQSWAWRQHLGGDAVGKHVLVCLADWANDHGNGFQVCWHCQASIAARVEVSRETVRRTLKRLEERGIIHRQERFNANGKRISDLITLQMDWQPPQGPGKEQPPKDEPPQNMGASPHKSRGTPPQIEGETPSNVGTNPNINPNRNLTSSLRSDVSAGAHAPSSLKGQSKGKTAPLDRKATRLPEDWLLPPDWSDWTLGEFAVTAAEIADAAASFRDYWCGKSGADAKKLDWLATWRNWCRREFRRKRRTSTEPVAQTSPAQLERQKWAGRLKILNESGRWPRETWGPAPGEPGCLAPPELLKAHGGRAEALVA